MAFLDRNIFLKMNLLEELGITSLPEEKKSELLHAMAETLGQRITLRAIEALSEEDANKLKQLADENSEASGQFLEEHVPNLAELVKDEIAKFKSEMVAAGFSREQG